MKTLYVKPTDTCNLDCDHCFTSGSLGDKTPWDIDQTVHWIGDLMATYPDEDVHIEFHGGEPFLRPIDEHLRFVSLLRDKVGDDRFTRVSFGAITNLVYKLTDTHIAFFTQYLDRHVGTSWDPVHRFKRDYQYQRWLDNVTQLRALGLTITLFVTVTRSLLEWEMMDLLLLWASFGVTEIAIERLTLDGNATRHPELFPSNESIDQFYYDLYKAYKSQDWPYRIRTLDTIEEKFKTHHYHVDTNCRHCEQHLFTLSANGAIGGCANGAKSESKDHISMPIDQVLNSEARQARIIHELSPNPTCLSCDLYDVCVGDCHRLPWDDRCPGLTKLLRYFKYNDTLIPVIQIEVS